MNDLQRFLGVAKGEEPDYVPIFGMPGAPGMSGGAMELTYDRLVDTGMPFDVGGSIDRDGNCLNFEGWHKYWGTTSPLDVDAFSGKAFYAPEYTAKLMNPLDSHINPEDFICPIQYSKRIEDGFEIYEYETGALTRQVVDNDITYSMPEFRSFHVRDRKSWEYYRKLSTPVKPWTTREIDSACTKYDKRDRPIRIKLFSTFGALRNLMGPEAACTIFYDDPKLLQEIMEWFMWLNRTYIFPFIERIKPEIVVTGEDMCYNHGMFISPSHFRQYCMPAYLEISKVVRENDVTVFGVDSDGFVEELACNLEECGVNALFPWEVKAGNDLDRVRKKHPKMIFFGGLEKEVVNEGNDHLIKSEIMTKVPKLLKYSRYFPNGDHGLQPLITFPSMCKFMTLLHEVCRNPEGQFPRMK